MNCPHCGKAIPTRSRAKPKPVPVDPGSVDTSQMSITELYKHFESTSGYFDVVFFIKHGRSRMRTVAMRGKFDAFLEVMRARPKWSAKTRHEWATLKGEYWTAVLEAERAENREEDAA